MTKEYGTEEYGTEADLREIERVADAWAAAIVADDADAMAECMAEEWCMVAPTGIDGRDKLLSLVRSGTLSHSAMERVGPARVRVYGDTAVWSARVTNTAHYGGERYDADEWTTDVYVRRRGRWVCVLTQTTPAGSE
ncbi:nuclear transport factor 2 family protein [Streptomyces sp. CA-288835]|uniref:nuclear transport factor 2 family protein n=1 Tax=Streptomyces sp. CA-288835 TaxID=3240069 RepID=UPI003D906D9F